MEQNQHAGNGKIQRQPETLLERPGDLTVAPGALELRHGGRNGLQHAGQRKQYGDVDAAANGNGGQILRTIMAQHHRIGNHHAHCPQLRHQHRHGMQDDQSGLLEKHGRSGANGVRRNRNRKYRAMAKIHLDAG